MSGRLTNSGVTSKWNLMSVAAFVGQMTMAQSSTSWLEFPA